jgi:hypothetical protein
VVKVVDFNPLPVTAVGLNPDRVLGFSHVRKLFSKLRECLWFYQMPVCA